MCICPVNKKTTIKTKEYFYFYLQESSAPLKFQTNPACCPLYSSLYRRSVQRYGQLNLQEKNIKIFIFLYVHNNHSQYCKAIAHPVDIINLCLIKKLLEKLVGVKQTNKQTNKQIKLTARNEKKKTKTLLSSRIHTHLY